MNDTLANPATTLDLSLPDLITAAESVAAGLLPSDVDFSSPWITENIWGEDGPWQGWGALAVGLTYNEEQSLEVSPALQARVLEAALRELMGIIEDPPEFKNGALSNEFRRMCRRELTRLLGRWMDLERELH